MFRKQSPTRKPRREDGGGFKLLLKLGNTLFVHTALAAQRTPAFKYGVFFCAAFYNRLARTVERGNKLVKGFSVATRAE
ncbi:hypothetical protein [Pseudomonas syringae]|uniref:hypothetical protein n=1 Tax=Pseudomonas syringae TaxID=317 RepID=UPI00217FEC81